MVEEQVKKLLKLQNCCKTIHFPANWIAGVEYDDDKQNEDEIMIPRRMKMTKMIITMKMQILMMEKRIIALIKMT